MHNRFQRHKQLSGVTDINVTPLIDLAFALLIIFMIVAPLLEQTVPVELPTEDARETTQLEAPEAIALSLDASGQLYWQQTPMRLEELKERLKLLSLEDEAMQPVLHVRADATLPYQRVMEIITAIKSAGLTKLSLDTRVE